MMTTESAQACGGLAAGRHAEFRSQGSHHEAVPPSGNNSAAFFPGDGRGPWHNLETERLLCAGYARSTGESDQSKGAHGFCAHRSQRRSGKRRPKAAAYAVVDIRQPKNGHGDDELVSLRWHRLAAQSAGVGGPEWQSLAEL